MTEGVRISRSRHPDLEDFRGFANEEGEEVGRFEDRTETTAQRPGREGAASGGKYERVDHRGSSELQEPNCHTVDIVCKEPACHTADGAPRGPPPDRPDVRKLQLRPAIAELTFDLQILLFLANFVVIVGSTSLNKQRRGVEQAARTRSEREAREKRARSEENVTGGVVESGGEES